MMEEGKSKGRQRKLVLLNSKPNRRKPWGWRLNNPIKKKKKKK